MTRLTRIGVPLLLALTAACSEAGPAFPDAISFDRRPLAKDTSWTRGRMSGVVYVPPGEKLPAASLQIGAILSGDHVSADALHAWVRDQQRRSAAMHFHAADAADESCRIARSGDRTYIALEVCKTGVARAVCVEADEAVKDDTVMACVGGSIACFQDLCDARWTARREALDSFAADVLTVR